MMYVVYVDWNEREREIRNYTSFVYIDARVVSFIAARAMLPQRRKKKRTANERAQKGRLQKTQRTEKPWCANRPHSDFRTLGLGRKKRHAHTTDRQTDTHTHENICACRAVAVVRSPPVDRPPWRGFFSRLPAWGGTTYWYGM